MQVNPPGQYTIDGGETMSTYIVKSEDEQWWLTGAPAASAPDPDGPIDLGVSIELWHFNIGEGTPDRVVLAPDEADAFADALKRAAALVRNGEFEADARKQLAVPYREGEEDL